MAGTNNFIPFDSTGTNMTADAAYATNAATLAGMTIGVADPAVFNKAVHQATIMAAALAGIAADNGASVSDADLATLKTAMNSLFSNASHAATADTAAGYTAGGGIDTAIAAKAPLASPTFTGTPFVPTAIVGTNTAQAASCAFVKNQIAANTGNQSLLTNPSAWIG